jgi:hypothetical protein
MKALLLLVTLFVWGCEASSSIKGSEDKCKDSVIKLATIGGQTRECQPGQQIEKVNDNTFLCRCKTPASVQAVGVPAPVQAVVAEPAPEPAEEEGGLE